MYSFATTWDLVQASSSTIFGLRCTPGDWAPLGKTGLALKACTCDRAANDIWANF